MLSTWIINLEFDPPRFRNFLLFKTRVYYARTIKTTTDFPCLVWLRDRLFLNLLICIPLMSQCCKIIEDSLWDIFNLLSFDGPTKNVCIKLDWIRIKPAKIFDDFFCRHLLICFALVCSFFFGKAKILSHCPWHSRFLLFF